MSIKKLYHFTARKYLPSILAAGLDTNAEIQVIKSEPQFRGSLMVDIKVLTYDEALREPAQH